MNALKPYSVYLDQRKRIQINQTANKVLAGITIGKIPLMLSVPKTTLRIPRQTRRQTTKYETSITLKEYQKGMETNSK